MVNSGKVNCRTTNLLEETDISVLRGKQKVKFLSSCRLCKRKPEKWSSSRELSASAVFWSVTWSQRTTRWQEIFQRSLDGGSSFSSRLDHDGGASADTQFLERGLTRMDVVAQEIQKEYKST
jgi:hypothetical protein